MTPVQIESAYRLAVESCLVEFYGRTRESARSLVNRWWKAASSSPDAEVQSGAYLHTEAINTATDLADCHQVEFTPAVRRKYSEILRQSSLIATKQKQTRAVTAA